MDLELEMEIAGSVLREAIGCVREEAVEARTARAVWRRSCERNMLSFSFLIVEG